MFLCYEQFSQFGKQSFMKFRKRLPSGPICNDAGIIKKEVWTVIW